MKSIRKTAVMILMVTFFSIPLMSSPFSADQTQQMNITQGSRKIRMSGKLPLYFEDAESGQPLKNVLVVISTPERNVYFSDVNGFVALPKLADGDYSINISVQDYITESHIISVKAGFIPNYRFALSRRILNKKFRIVLQWGERPADLDLHLEKQGGYHISYRDMITCDDGSANLDRDDVSSYGPETITINKLDRLTNYFIYVIDYTNRSNALSTSLSYSSAFVKIYGEDTLLYCCSIPQGIAGNRWNVCTIQNGEIIINDSVVKNY
ncbi:MAG: hypothetical protein J5747_10135 [Spirochaetaceae bacterium]|nr:hypothetical protein [Spirochaetaceae bacterium]